MIEYRLSSSQANHDGTVLRAESTDRSFFWAAYDRDGVRIATCPTASADWLATADAAAPAKAAELFAVRDAAVAAKQTQEQATKGAIKASFGGTCAVTSRRFTRGTLIRNTNYGWVIADAATLQTLQAGTMGANDPNWLSRQMDREDSMF